MGWEGIGKGKIKICWSKFFDIIILGYGVVFYIGRCFLDIGFYGGIG